MPTCVAIFLAVGPMTYVMPLQRPGERKSKISTMISLLHCFSGEKEAVIHHGKTMHFSPKNEVYVYFRYDDKKSIMVILNANKEDQIIDFERYAERIGKTQKGKDVFSKEEVLFLNTLTIPAKSTKIISFKTP